MRTAKGLETIDGMEYIASIPSGETIVGLVVKDGTLYAASDKHLYKMINNKRLEKTSNHSLNADGRLQDKPPAG